MRGCLARAAELLPAGETLVLVTVAKVRGSAPRETGATMLVSARETFGTIGGGQLEFQCTKIAVERLREPGAALRGALRRFPLGANCGQCCGGVVDVLFDTLTLEQQWVSQLLEALDGEALAMLARWRDPDGQVRHSVAANGVELREDLPGALAGDDAVSEELGRVEQDGRARSLIAADGSQLLLQSLRGSDFTIAIFGAGHVGTATAAVLATLNTNIRWIDSRAGLLPEKTPANVQTLRSSEPAREVAALPDNTWYLVMTHSHPLDYEICRAVLARGNFAYLGLIGSQAKRRRFEKRFLVDQVSGVDRLSCPIGVAGIGGKTPSEIAIAVAADLLKRRELLQHGGATSDLRPVRAHRRAG